MDINEATGDPGEGVDRGVAAIEAARADWGRLLSAHRDRLRRMVALRLDQRLRGRIDPSDVIQEAFLEATERRPEYVRQPDPMPPFLWLRFLTLQRLQLIHRQQLGTRSRGAGARYRSTAARSPRRPRRPWRRGSWAATRRPSEAAIRAEEKRRLQDALDLMDPIDREVLVLRHFEQLSNGECARVLGLRESAATKRYLRALRRLKEILSPGPGAGMEAGP